MRFSVKPVLLVFAFSNLVVGMLSGLGRMGWQMPLPEMYVHHGAIMVGGFLGSLISLEKVIPLKKPAYFIGPLLSAISIILFLLGNFQVAVIMLIVSAAVLVLIYLNYLNNQWSIYLALALIGALCWCTGNVLLLRNRFYPMAFPWWMGFILFTIVSERLELSKFLPVTAKDKYLLFTFMGLFLLGLLLPFHGAGTYVVGASMVLVSMWLLRYDVISLTIKKEGLTRFTAIALLAGYVSLLLEGIFLIVLKGVPNDYDIIVHTYFIGFVFAMIFAHGPIILPGVLGLSVRPYHPWFYIPLIILLTSLAMRTTADLGLIPFSFRAVSGWISAGAILLYFVLMITAILRSVRHAKVA